MTRELADLCRKLYGVHTVRGSGTPGSPYNCQKWNEKGMKGKNFRKNLKDKLMVFQLSPVALIAHQAAVKIVKKQYNATYLAKHGPRVYDDTWKNKLRLSTRWRKVCKQYATDNNGADIKDVDELYEAMYLNCMLEFEEEEAKKIVSRIIEVEIKYPPR